MEPTRKARPADRLSAVKEYYFSRKLKEVAALNAAGRDIISLAIGSPDMPPPPGAVEALCATARDPHAHGYQPTGGTPELRGAMAAFYRNTYGVEIDPEGEILPLIGSKEGILHVTLALCNPGDTVLVPNPGYPTYTSLSTLLGAKVRHYPLKEDNGWQPDLDAIEAGGMDGVKIMWTNYPHMPTGAKARMETYERLAAFARKHGITIVNDNPYSMILNSRPLSILQVEGAKDCCIELNSLSKSHNMPGWRVGMCISNPEAISWVTKVKSNIDSGTFRGIQMAAAAALQDTTEEWHREHNNAVYSRRRAAAQDVMETLGCTVGADQAGMFLWGRIPANCPGAEAMADRVLQEARVFITPGSIFGSEGERYVRLSLCAPVEKIEAAMERIKQAGITY